MSTDLAILLRPFHPDLYEKQEKGLIYLPGPAIEQRLDRATEGQWRITQREVKAVENALAVTIWIELPGYPPRPGHGLGRVGSGSDYGDALQSADTAAIRRAANRFGVGRELWPECMAEHWLNWIGLLTTADQVPEARQLASAFGQGMKSIGGDKATAWERCKQQVAEALRSAASRCSGAVPSHEPAAVQPEAKSDAGTMRTLSAKFGEVLKAVDYEVCKRLRDSALAELKTALSDGRIRSGGECEAALTKQAADTLAHLRSLAGGQQTKARTEAEALVAAFESPDLTTEAYDRLCTQLERLYADGHVNGLAEAAEEAKARAAERLGDPFAE